MLLGVEEAMMKLVGEHHGAVCGDRVAAGRVALAWRFLIAQNVPELHGGPLSVS